MNAKTDIVLANYKAVTGEMDNLRESFFLYPITDADSALRIPLRANDRLPGKGGG